MTETNINQPEIARRRQIGTVGTVARVLIGSLMLVYGLTGGRIESMHSNVQTGFDPLSVGVGVVAFPALLLGWQWIRAGGCEVLAISNWILRRDDQIGCLVLSPIDDYERRLKSTHSDRHWRWFRKSHSRPGA